MAVKRNRWLVVSVLVVAVGAFLAISVLPILAGRSDRPTASPPSQTATETTDPRAELEATARGYELVLEREPDNQTAIEGLVDARLRLGDLEGVVEPLEKLADLNPQVPGYRVLLGQTKQRLGDLEGAAQAYRSVLQENPGEMTALQGLVALLIEQERPQAAIGLLQDTLQTAATTNEINPGTIDPVSVRLLLAQVYVEAGQPDEALRVYDQTIDLAADDFRPVLAKALVLRDVGQGDEAAVLFKQAEEMAPAQFKDQVRQLASDPAAAAPEDPANDPAAPTPEAPDAAATDNQDDAEE